MNIRKRLYRGTMLFLVVFLLAPMQDGYKFEKTQASAVQKAAAPAAACPSLMGDEQTKQKGTPGNLGNRDMKLQTSQR